ncbi:hypothetical protein [uncultured Vibrio sp.]|uniref:hypothetical protein n=1 Tax=uncultured Vibrio sp. TaxID=114054 RepID=UPI00091FA6A9|nr:hypothetical protein [uncultured Vibrio sp.]OIQ25893.1 MAG: hypothetical protein BM561_03415 [Vibrio sp. MedPE-SWchi]
MYMFISILITMFIILALSKMSKLKRSSLKRKYDSLVLLREILLLCRQHRMQTHHILQCTHEIRSNKALDAVYDKLMVKSSQLVRIVNAENKPMYRVFQRNLKVMHSSWKEQSISRNQIIHGKTIRHCMFLMDEIAITWLVESGRNDVSNQYHNNWQQVFDCMELLTQLRVVIQDYHNPTGKVRINHYCQKMSSKLNQLSIICPLAMGAPTSSNAMDLLNEISTSQDSNPTEHELYQLTSDISLVIAQVYDHILSDMTKQLYHQLPAAVLN